MIFLLLDCNW